MFDIKKCDSRIALVFFGLLILPASQAGPPPVPVAVVPRPPVQGKLTISKGVELNIREIQESEQTIIEIGSATLTLPSKYHAMQMITENGFAAALVGNKNQYNGYEDLSIFVFNVTPYGLNIFNCAKQASLNKAFKTFCYIDRIVSIEESGIVKLEIDYYEKPQPPTKVLSKIIWWDTRTDKEVEDPQKPK